MGVKNTVIVTLNQAAISFLATSVPNSRTIRLTNNKEPFKHYHSNILASKTHNINISPKSPEVKSEAEHFLYHFKRYLNLCILKNASIGSTFFLL